MIKNFLSILNSLLPPTVPPPVFPPILSHFLSSLLPNTVLPLYCPINHPTLINRPTVPNLPTAPTPHLAQPSCPAGTQGMPAHTRTNTQHTLEPSWQHWPAQTRVWRITVSVRNFCFEHCTKASGRMTLVTMWGVGVAWQDPVLCPSLSSTHPFHASIHQLTNPFLLVLSHAFIAPHFPITVFIFTTTLTHLSLWLITHLLLLSHLLPVLPLLARVARQCSNAICLRSMPSGSCPHTPTRLQTHTHAQLGKDTFQCRIYRYPCFRYQITKVPRIV